MVSQFIPYEMPGLSSLPANKVGWRINTQSCALLVHDVQLYFLATYNNDVLVRTLLKNIGALVEWAAKNNIPVFYSAQDVQTDIAERGLLTDMWGKGLLDPDLVPLAPEVLHPQITPRMIDKKRYSAFMYTNFEQELEELGINQLIITGIYANIGCAATATDAFMRDIQTFFVADAVADFNEKEHMHALERISQHIGVNTTTQEVLQCPTH